MITVIKKGKLKDKRETVEAKCASCDTEFTFEKGDVKKDSPDKGMYVTCPLEECGHHIRVSDETYGTL